MVPQQLFVFPCGKKSVDQTNNKQQILLIYILKIQLLTLAITYSYIHGRAPESTTRIHFKMFIYVRRTGLGIYLSSLSLVDYVGNYFEQYSRYGQNLLELSEVL